MNLAIDYGNTRIKVGLFEQSTLHEQMSFQDITDLKKWLLGKKIHNIIVSSVSHSSSQLIKDIGAIEVKIELTQSTPLPIHIKYLTPQTLGVDRIAAACGATDLIPKKDCLVIDVGTCINYEFVDAELNYQGGAISPGIAMRFEAMHTFTARLPLVMSKQPVELIGKSTEECMQSGVINGVIGEMEGFINKYKIKYPNLVVILCGGDAPLFENSLKQPIFVAPNLVLSGLNKILLHNVNL